MKAKKRSRPGRRLGRKHQALFPLRRPVLLVALGLAGWAPAGAADFPPTLELSSLDGTNGFRLDGAAADDRSGFAVSGAGDVNGDGLADLLIGADGAGPNGALSGASYVVFGQTGLFPASLNLSLLDGTNGFRLDGAEDDRSGIAVSAAGDVNGDGLADLLIGAPGAPNGERSGASYVVFGQPPSQPTAATATATATAATATTAAHLQRLARHDPGHRQRRDPHRDPRQRRHRRTGWQRRDPRSRRQRRPLQR